MTQNPTSPADPGVLGHRYLGSETLERWSAHANPKKVVVTVLRRNERGFWKEDASARRVVLRDEWERQLRSADNSMRTSQQRHALNSIAIDYYNASVEGGSLRARMLYEILEEILDADVTADDEWLIGLWRLTGRRHQKRNGWVRSAGEAPLRKGSTKGAAQRQLMDAVVDSLAPFKASAASSDAPRLALDAARTIITRVGENFPVEANESVLIFNEPAATSLQAEILKAWHDHDGPGFPDDDAVRRIVRRALIASGMPKRISYSFFHGEHEAARRSRAKGAKK